MRANGSNNESDAVEISGWDLSNRFFIERTHLFTDGEGAKSAFLHARLRRGMLIFARFDADRSRSAESPIAFRVDLAEPAADLCRVKLVPPKQFYVPGFEATSERFERLMAQGSRIEADT